MQIAAGKPVFHGVATGVIRAFRRRTSPARRESALTVQEELARFEGARAQAIAQLESIRDAAVSQVGEENAAIFEVQAMMLEDEDYLEAVRRAIREGVSAEWAVSRAGEDFAAALAALEDPGLRARAADVEDMSGRVAGILAGVHQEEPWAEPCILMADDLSPSETVGLDRDKLLGFVTRHGSVNSHTAILARTMGIPALVGVELDPDWDGHRALLDGWEGRLYVDPDPAVLAAGEARSLEDARQAARLQELKGLPDVTRDGTQARVCANIGGLEDLEAALASGAQGIGLFRSEFLFLGRNACPTEDAQFAVYKRAVQAMGGKRVVIRTLDIGADKRADWLALEPEENPALGLRAIRLCLARPQLFRAQLRAILRASAFGQVAVMFPMVISVEEVRQARALLSDCRRELEGEGAALGPLEVGIMIETPAAALTADALAREVDFFSIGTNDLTQYTLALDRQDRRLEPLFDPRHPAVLTLIRMTAEAGRRHGVRVAVCGELAADPAMAGTFLGMGVEELSVPPAAVLPLRQQIRSLDLGEGPNPRSGREN